MIKRTFDILFAIAGLVISAPFLLILSVAIKATSKGPVFFRQERVGRFGKPFIIYKLRTMVADASAKGPGISPRAIRARRASAGFCA